jgi:hypothetical protein
MKTDRPMQMREMAMITVFLHSTHRTRVLCGQFRMYRQCITLGGLQNVTNLTHVDGTPSSTITTRL